MRLPTFGIICSDNQWLVTFDEANAMRTTGVDPHRPRTPSAAKLKSEEQLLRSVVDLSAFQGSSPVELKDMLARRGLRASLVSVVERPLNISSEQE